MSRRLTAPVTIREVSCLLLGLVGGITLSTHMLSASPTLTMDEVRTLVAQQMTSSGKTMGQNMFRALAAPSPGTPKLLPSVSKRGAQAVHLVSAPFDRSTLLASAFDVAAPGSDVPDSRYYTGLLEAQLELCGDLCSPTAASHELLTGPVGDTRIADVHCDRLYATDLFEELPSRWPPPLQIPASMRSNYTLGAGVRDGGWGHDRQFGGKMRPRVWATGRVATMVAAARKGTLDTGEGRATNRALRTAIFDADLENKTVVVIGSGSATVPALLLGEGATKVYVLDHRPMATNHTQLVPITPLELNRLYRSGSAPRFDAVVALGTLDGIGLGRFGDQLNPWGDVIQLAKLWCLMPKGGKAVIGARGVVKEMKGEKPRYKWDLLHWNRYRQYGFVRFPYLLSNFKVYRYHSGAAMPLFLAEKLP